MNVDLKKLVISDLSPFYTWLADNDVIKYSLSIFQNLNSKTAINTWFTKLIETNDELVLGIFLQNTSELIGYAGICCLNKERNIGEYFIFIGNKDYWGKGVSTEVTKRIVELGFSQLKLHKIILTVFEDNIGGQKSYKRVGFKETGILKNARLIDNKMQNKIIMSLEKSISV